MKSKRVSMWYDPKGDFLEIMWEFKEGSVIPTYDDRVMARVDENGNILGFHILAASSVGDKPIDIMLDQEPPEDEG